MSGFEAFLIWLVVSATAEGKNEPPVQCEVENRGGYSVRIDPYCRNWADGESKMERERPGGEPVIDPPLEGAI